MAGEAVAAAAGIPDLACMRAACGLARRALGNAWPNPAVGCVLVNEGRVVGRGWTQPGGRPHAETEALFRAGPRARGATAATFGGASPPSHVGIAPSVPVRAPRTLGCHGGGW